MNASMARRSVGAVIGLLTTTYERWRRHRTIRLGAGIAYYGLFAIVPVIAVAIAFAGIFINQQEVTDYLSDQLSARFDVDGTEVATAVSDALAGTGTVTALGLVGLVGLVFTASVLVVALQDAFNTIWERPVRSGLRNSVLRRLGAFAVVASSGALLIVAFALNTVGGIIESLLPDSALFAPIPELFGFASAWALGIGTLMLLLRFLPDAPVRWRSALIGGAVTAVFVAVGTAAIGAYLRRVGGASVAGATSSVFLVLVWIYYEAQILLAGAELTCALDRPEAARDGEGETPVGDGETPVGDGETPVGDGVTSVGDDREPSGRPGEDAAVDVAD